MDLEELNKQWEEKQREKAEINPQRYGCGASGSSDPNEHELHRKQQMYMNYGCGYGLEDVYWE